MGDRTCTYDAADGFAFPPKDAVFSSWNGARTNPFLPTNRYVQALEGQVGMQV